MKDQGVARHDLRPRHCDSGGKRLRL